MFEASALSTAERRRFQEAFERVAKPARRKPAMIHSVRHHGAQYDAATVVLVLATHAMIDREDKPESEKAAARRDCIIAGLAHLAEQRLALLAMLAETPDADVVMEAQTRDLTEDLSEKKHDMNPSPSTCAEWLTDSLLELSAAEAKCAAIRPRALEAYGTRGPKSAA